MTPKRLIFAWLSLMVIGGVLWATGQEQANTPHPAAPASASAPAATPSHTAAFQDAAAARLEGEKRFRANCGRCHMAPRKFPPRVMATVVRHMRVRATITDEDMRLILRYITE